MNLDWDELVRRALLGTERDGSPVSVDGLDASDPETMLLSAAAMASVFRRAGRDVRAAEKPTASIAPPEDKRVIGDRAVRDAIDLLIEPRYRDLIPEWLEAVAAADLVVSPRLLPALLEMGRRTPKAAARVREVIGHRGFWLASLNPQWRLVVGPAEAKAEDVAAQWETASPAERTLLFSQLRATDPAGARERIEATWSVEAARDRAAYIERMETGLSMDDEPFLEAQLDSKSKEVRRAAARVLGHLPESRLAKRMAARALSYVHFEGDRLDVKLPDAVDDAMERDGVVAKAAGEEGGHRAWWLAQICAAAPPSAFVEKYQRSPAELLEVAAASEWRRTVEGGFVTAAVAYRDVTFIEALIRHRIGLGDDALWNHLPAERRERLFSQLLDAARGRLATHRVLAHVPKIEGPWADELSAKVVRAVETLVSTEDRMAEFQARSVLRDVGKKLAPDAYEALSLVYERIPESSYWKSALRDGVQTLERRAAMLRALRED